MARWSKPVEPDQLQRGGNPSTHLILRQFCHAEPEADIPEDIEVREEGIALEHEAESPEMGRDGGDVLPVPGDRARFDRHQPRDGP